MITVKALSKHSGVSEHAVRYYSRIGLLKPSRNPDNGYRLFDRTDVTRLRFIRHAQNLGFSLSEIAEILEDADLGHSPCTKVRDYIRSRIEENRNNIQGLQDLQARMEQALAVWEQLPNKEPNAKVICHLIDQAFETKN